MLYFIGEGEIEQAIEVFGEASFGIASAILTILILIITEIIPKTIGAKYWRKLSKFSYYTIKFMIVVSYPLVIMSEFITKIISNSKVKHTTSREEIAALANIDGEVFTSSSFFGFFAIMLAAINIFGGFLVTQRMLAMYKKKKKDKK